VGLERLGYRDTAAGRRKMVEDLDRRALAEGRKSGLVPLPAEVNARMSHLRRGWYWGRQEFAEKLRRLLGPRLQSANSRAYLRTPQRVSHGPEEAERLVVEGIKAAGLGTKDLQRSPGGDPCKVRWGSW
jgi:putative transposase